MVHIVLLLIGGLGVLSGAIRLMMWSDRVNRQRAERRYQAWTDSGRVGPAPRDYMGHGNTSVGG
jgi:hypothetical protein